jgi:hypothetical protein
MTTAGSLARRAGWKGVSAVRVQKGRERAVNEGLDCWRCLVLGEAVLEKELLNSVRLRNLQNLAPFILYSPFCATRGLAIS